jgi:hypothetical protein
MTLTLRQWRTFCARGVLAAILLLVLLGLAAPSGLARAADSPPKLGIRPADGDRLYVDLTLKPGEHRTLDVELINGGTALVQARTYTADAYTLVNGGFGVRLEDDSVTGPTTWLDYPREDLDLAPGQAEQRGVTVTVPKGTAPGEYVAALVIQNAEPVKGTGDITVNQVLRQAIAVAITVPGKRTPGLAIGAASYKRTPAVASVLVSVTNTGNVRLKPSGELVLTDKVGHEVLRAPVAMDTFFAGNTTEIEVNLPLSLPEGDYSVALDLSDIKAGASAQSDSLALAIAD